MNENNIYPLTVTQDRYTGAYSGGKYTAWNHDPQDIPPGIVGEDTECRCTWAALENDKTMRKMFRFGVGDTIYEAIAALVRDIEERGEAPEYLDGDSPVRVTDVAFYDESRTVEHCTICVHQRIYVDGSLAEERYDHYRDCTADIWSNSATGKQSVGWRRNFN